MTVADRNIECVAGEAIACTIPVVYQQKVGNAEVPVDMAGAVATVRVKVFATAELLLEKPATIDVDAAEISFVLESEDTATAGNFYWDCLLVDVAGRPFVVARGALVVRAAPVPG